ncbi:hypothetical protein NE237_001451 [Protea cynaroides]|uniref:RNase H type-1 domain-containing protein n=1 Tax=Protea cynaroides TaxID=273540 RepID=A0A9Q0QY48_9MAGN|nr:hypothetical protein NE237_001451 [Protea cynaroides]
MGTYNTLLLAFDMEEHLAYGLGSSLLNSVFDIPKYDGEREREDDPRFAYTHKSLDHIPGKSIALAFFLLSLQDQLGIQNDLYFKDKEWSPVQVIQRASAAFADFVHTYPRLSSVFDEDLSRHSGCCWTPPPVGVIKINCDAAFREDDSKCSIDFVFRDSASNPILTVSQSIAASFAFMGEALAIRSVLLVAVLHATYREANMVAHSLAQAAMLDVHLHFWPVSTPCLVDICRANAPAVTGFTNQ